MGSSIHELDSLLSSVYRAAYLPTSGRVYDYSAGVVVIYIKIIQRSLDIDSVDMKFGN